MQVWRVYFKALICSATWNKKLTMAGKATHPHLVLRKNKGQDCSRFYVPDSVHPGLTVVISPLLAEPISDHHFFPRGAFDVGTEWVMFSIVNIQGHTRDKLLPTSMWRSTLRCDFEKKEMKQLNGILSCCYFNVCSVLQALANQVFC